MKSAIAYFYSIGVALSLSVAVAAEPTPAKELPPIVPADELEVSMLKAPVNPEALADRAMFLSIQGDCAATPEEARALRKRAYAFASHAAKGGAKNLLVPIVLVELNEDGTQKAHLHSDNAAINALMTDAEAKFARHDLPAAITGYQEVLKLEPRNYNATLYTGDVYFGDKEFATAIQWFDRAIAIDPDRETAHRYRADALMRLRRLDEAGPSYINAFVAAPFQPIPTEALNRWIGAKKLTLRRLNTSFIVGEIKMQKGEPAIHLDSKHVDPLCILYTTARTAYVLKHPPTAKEYRQTLAEEADALRTTLQILDTLDTKDPAAAAIVANLETLKRLQQIERDGLLEAFILFDRPNKELVQDYTVYQSAHRDLLAKYIRTVWLGLP